MRPDVKDMRSQAEYVPLFFPGKTDAKSKLRKKISAALLVLLAVLGVHVLFFASFRSWDLKVQNETSSRRYTIVLPVTGSPRLLAEKEKEYGLHYWLKTGVMDRSYESAGKERLLKEKFSSDLRRRMRVSRVKTFQKIRSTANVSGDVRDVPRTLGSFSAALPEQTGKGTVTVKETNPVRYPLWKISGEGDYNTLLPSPGAIHGFDTLQKNAKDPTILRIVKRESHLPPEVIIVSSCGEPELDKFALLELSRFSGTGKYLKKLQSVVCSVLWRLPEADYTDPSDPSEKGKKP